MRGTSPSEKEKEKDVVREDSDSADSDVDPTSSLRMTYGPTSEVVERAPVVVSANDTAGSKIQKEGTERP